MYFLTVLEAGKSKIKVFSRFISNEASLPGLQMALLHVALPRYVSAESELSGVSFIRQ